MIAVVHLVWGPLGPAPLRDFLASYHARPAGVDHELVVVFNGVGVSGVTPPEARTALLAELADTEHRLIELERPVLDLAAYGHAAERLDHERICFLNSYSVLLANHWLAHLAAAHDQTGVGLAGATGSYESHADWRRGPLHHRFRNLVALTALRGDFPPFPNPHVRTNGMLLARELVETMRLGEARDKHSAYLRESGRRSITRQVEERGLRAVVVGRDGRVYSPDEWPSSATFRSGDQERLLVADNQTRAYQEASLAERAAMRRNTWGRRAP
jgi:hypothetical protein